MCGRVVQVSDPSRLAIVDGLHVPDSGENTWRPRYNGASHQEFLIIRLNHETGERTLEPLRWGLSPSWKKDAKGDRKPINCRSETVATRPSFRDAYQKRRCILPVDGFFEWKAIKGEKKQPYAIAMKNGSPFGIAGIWEIWKHPKSGERIATFAILTIEANELVGHIHPRMPLILNPADYERWLGPEPDPRDLMVKFGAYQMKMWPVSTRVNAIRNDGPAILNEALLPLRRKADDDAKSAGIFRKTDIRLRYRRQHRLTFGGWLVKAVMSLTRRS